MPFYVKKGTTWKYTGVDSLEQVVMGSIREYSYGDDVNAYIEKHCPEGKCNKKRVNVLNTLKSAVNMLQKGRIQAFF